MQTLSRRDALRGAAAAAAMSAVSATALAASHIDSQILALERERLDISAKRDEESEFYLAQYDKLPDWARSGPDGRGRELGWPDVSDLPEFQRLVIPSMVSRRPRLGEVRKYNRYMETWPKEDTERYAEIRARPGHCDRARHGWC